MRRRVGQRAIQPPSLSCPPSLASSAEDVEWTEAEGFPTAGTYRGHDEVVQGVFMPLVQDYEGSTVTPELFVGDGDTVISVGWYEGICRATAIDKGRSCTVRSCVAGARRKGGPLRADRRQRNVQPSAELNDISAPSPTATRPPRYCCSG